MFIEKNSILRNLPVALNKRQLRMLVGIRYSIEMYEVAYVTLVDKLKKIIKETDKDADTLPFIILHAWSMIDSANRLRTMLSRMPGVKKKGSKYYSLVNKLELIEDLRNIIQHLDGEINSRAKDIEVKSVWGSLSWGKIINKDPFEADVFLIMPGSIESQSDLPINNILGKSFYDNVDSIELSAYGITVSLSDTYRTIGEIAKLLESSLSKDFKDKPELKERYGSDLIARIRLSLEDQVKTNVNK